MNEDIFLRDIREPDIKAIASIHAKSFPESAFSVLGNGTLIRYYAWLLHGPHEAECVALIKGHDVIGFGIGGKFTNATKGFLTRNRGYLILQFLTRPWLFLSKSIRSQLRLTFSLLKPGRKNIGKKSAEIHDRPIEPDRYFGVLSIAVSPAYRRVGGGGRLLAELERRASARGFNEMRLSVLGHNLGAQEFYRRSGWVLAENKGKSTIMIKQLVS